MTRLLSKPQLIVNGSVIPVVPNTMKVKYGYGTKTIKAESLGGDSLKIVTGYDLSENIGCLTVQVFSNELNINRALDLLDLNKTTELEVDFSDPQNGIAGVIKNCSIVNEPEFEYSADGKFELEFKGDKVIRG